MELKKEVWERVQKDAERMLEEVELSRVHATLMLNRAKMELNQIEDIENEELRKIEGDVDKIQEGEKEGVNKLDSLELLDDMQLRLNELTYTNIMLKNFLVEVKRLNSKRVEALMKKYDIEVHNG